MELWLRNWEFLCFASISQLQNTLQNGALAAKLGVFMLRCHFTAAKHPAKWGFGCEIGSFLCFAAVSQLQNTLRNGALAAKLGVFMLRDFAAVSQLRNESHCAAKWHSCAKKWLRSCEILCEMELSLRKWDLSCFGGSQPFRSCEMGTPVLRSGTRVPKVVSQLRKFSQRGA